MNDMQILFIRHGDCSDYLLTKISKLKKQYWNFSIKSQKKWFNENLSSDDIHLCIRVGKDLVAYTTLLNLQCSIIRDKWIRVFGIGSVCVDKKYLRQEYGFLVVQIATFYIKKKYSVGFLLCKDDLVPFYCKCNWVLYSGQLLIKDFDRQVNVMSTKQINSPLVIFKKAF